MALKFLQQIQLLLWKNFSIRRRQWLRNAVEIVWPLMLFLILVLVRKRRPAAFRDSDIYRPQALPSAGLFPFIRGFFCDFIDYGTSYNGNNSVDLPDNKMLFDIFEDVQSFLESRDLTRDPTISSLVESPDDVRQFLIKNLSFSPNLADSVLDARVNFSKFNGRSPPFLSRLLPFMVLGQPLQNRTVLYNSLQRACNTSSWGGYLIFLSPESEMAFHEAICNLSISQVNELPLEMRNQLRLPNGIIKLAQKVQENGGWYEAICGRKMDPSLTGEDDGPTTMKPEEEKEKEEAQNKIKKNSCAWMTPLDKKMSEFHNYTGNGKCSAVKPELRSDCGWGGINKKSCAKIGCCYDDSISDKFYCYCPENDRCCKFRACLLDNLGTSFSGGDSRRRSFFLQLMKTFLSAKILYTPDNQHTRRIIEKANFTFSEMGFVWEQIRMAAKNGNFQPPQIDPPGFLNSPNFNMLRLLLSLNGGASGFSERFQTIARLIADNGDCLSFDYFKPVKNEREAERLALTEKGYPPLATVVFKNVPDDAEELSPHVEYKIRQDIDTVQNPRWKRHRYWRPGPENSMYRLRYKFFGFIFLQDMIDRGITEAQTNETVKTGLFLQMMPYPCYIYDRFSYTISNSMPLFMTLAWIYSVGMIIKTIVHEKETRLKEVMKVMGLTNSVHWLAWFITSVIMMMITTILLVMVLKFGDILQYSDPSVIFVFFFVFTISTIMFCFLISVFFSRANVAAACGGLIYLTTYLPYVILTIFEENVNKSHLIASCLLSPTAFGIACRYFARFEEQGIGLQWNNLYSSPVYGDEFSVGGAMNMLIVDAFIYGLFTWYIEAVFPGDFGVPKPWYFPFMRSYWCPSRKRSRTLGSHHDTQIYRVLGDQAVELGSVDSPVTPADSNVAMEREPRHLPLGISMRNLKKVYSNGKVAVDDLSLNLYSGQITSFLGHNGAGKTTTMSLLTGIYPPTEGTAFIEGRDIRSSMDEIRSSLGICPQYNVLFDDLTVEEHLWFYAKLKGLDNNLIPDEIEKFLANSHLIPKRKERSRFLSGGMKRKLSVSMAFVAGSKTVILDEPTAGVDPYARRAIWDLLLQYKKGRTILLSTHHMDEADVLGDRIAIIAQGKLCCCGTSLFLKSQYGSGYYLTLVKKDLVSNVKTRALDAEPRRDSDDQSETSSRSIDEGVSLGDSASEVSELATDYDKPSQLSLTAFIKSYVAQAELVESVGTEMTYVLPTGESHGSKFENLFDALNQNLERFNISSFGVSDTTLEEVFLKVASAGSIEEEEEVKSSYPTRRISVRNEKSKFERFKLMFQRKQRSTAIGSVDEDDITQDAGEEDVLEDEEVSNDIDDVFRAPRIKPKATGLNLIKKQFIGLLKKRFNHAKRNRKGFISQIVLPALFVCLAMVSAMLRPPVGQLPALKLTTTDAIPQPNTMFFADATQSPSGKRLADTLVNPPGVGSYCVPLNCSKERLRFNKGYATVPRSSRFFQSCSCKTGTAVCSDKCCKYPPPKASSDTGDTVLNITLRDYNDYILRTTKQFRKKRYGGVTFGHKINVPERIRSNTDAKIRRLFATEGIKAWYSNKGYHAMPTFLSVATNTLLRERVSSKGTNPRRYGITTYNHPMNLTKGELSEATLKNMTRTDLVMAIFVIFALAFVPASFVVFLINERVSKAKHLHMVCGVNPLIYWVSNFVWDMCNYCIPAFCCICIFLAFQEKSYTSADNFGPTLLLLLLYGWSITPLMYPASFVFEISSTAYIALICINLFIGMNTTIATFVLEFFDDDAELQLINSYLKQIFLIFPNYCLGRGLIDLAKNQIFADVYKRFGSDIFKDPLSWDITGRNILSMFVLGFVYFAFTLLIEYRFFIKKRKVIGELSSGADCDDDVRNERQRVKNGDANSECLRLVNLTKVYQSKFSRSKNVAVKELCLGVPRGQCFGLLGVNGAGKTTTFKMLTGDISVTKGDAYINQHSVVDDILAARQSMGYCPQFDALNDLLTAREHLKLYARIRGIQEEDVNQVTDWCLRTLNLLQYADRCAGKYSGGNKRKLSTAISLVGECPIIFLDEPTTGMDPKARRFLWKVISDIVKDGRTIILTSHSMEECEALCGRIAIMVNGEFKCMGTPQHLKNKYGDGYTVILRIAGVMPDLEPVKNFMENTFLECVLKDQHHNMLEYQLHNERTSLSFVFGELERSREQLSIEEYSVSQTTLDQVFINFAKQQTDGMEPILPSESSDRLEPHSPMIERHSERPVEV
ncbi:ATP-binding cassette sub-family A member 1-like [Dendronephthya gigantea]|uniref:ATP-binding cassette sub-family A member 1-like n=1 Tax=Dendronephthya gigantea TaxID=151771 RepID=UPI00106CB2CC|nr:ATP-binding cassette sub-family A member 1-like [Dendronephthya gigantea]XP_028404447.1 ATP-binding cassette sub-family A member 1-like [Dendronephthya gigantea]